MRKVNIKKSESPIRAKAPWLVRWRELNGKCCQRAFPTKALAKMFADKQVMELNDDLFTSVKPLTLPELSEAFLSAKKSEGIAAATEQLYRMVMVDFELALQPSPPTTDRIAKHHIDEYKKTLTENQPATVNKKLQHLSGIFNWAIQRKYMRHNPIDRLDKLKTTKKLKDIYTPEQFRQLLDAAPDAQWRVFLYLAICGAGRHKSLAAALRNRIDQTDQSIEILDEKTRQWRRTPLHPSAWLELSNYLKTLPAGQQRLFTHNFQSYQYKALVAKAKLPFVKFHDLRTCMVSWLKVAGVQSEIVSSILGHSTVELTARHYTSIDNQANKRAAIDKLPI
ncbi:MAG: tyrosine-type recombinase/integrase [Sedimentisphaerales bacterium]|nr:tyrosine-type recombinase/integrase [Sedimentisphaerales bacterium]